MWRSEDGESCMVNSQWLGSQAQGPEGKWQQCLQMLINLQDLLSTIHEANQRRKPGPVLIQRPFPGSWGTDKRTVASQVLTMHMGLTSHLLSPALGLHHFSFQCDLPGGSLGTWIQALRHATSKVKYIPVSCLSPSRPQLPTGVSLLWLRFRSWTQRKLEPGSHCCLKDNGIEQFSILMTLSFPSPMQWE